MKGTRAAPWRKADSRTGAGNIPDELGAFCSDNVREVLKENKPRMRWIVGMSKGHESQLNELPGAKKLEQFE